MFLSRRATQAEYSDAADRPAAEVVEFYSSLARLNRLFLFAEPFQRLLPRLLNPANCASLSFLDLGAGDGSLGTQLSRLAAERHRWSWNFTNADFSLPALRLSHADRNVAASVLALPFRDASFDVVIASQMTHHLADDEIVRQLREAWRVARQAILLTDLHRGLLPYALCRLLFLLRGFPKHFREDALLSIRRGFRARELQALAEEAGVAGARVRVYHGSRVILQARKDGK